MPNYVTVICDLYDGQGNPVSAGKAIFTPSLPLTDALDRMMVTVAQVIAEFTAGQQAAALLLATDNTGPMPAGWAWTAGFSGVPGSAGSFSVLVPAGPVSFTATDASPAVFTWTPTADLTSLPDGTGVQLSGGSLPAGFTTGTTYYVVASSGDTFQLAATQGGSAIASTSTGSGSVTVVQYNLSALSPVYDVSPVSPYLPRSGGSLTGAIAPADVTLTDEASVPVDASLGNDFTLAMTSAVGSSRSMAAPSGPSDRQNITFLLIQPASGGPCTVTWASGAGGYDFGSAGAPSLSTGASAADLVGFKYVAGLARWCCLGAGFGY